MTSLDLSSFQIPRFKVSIRIIAIVIAIIGLLFFWWVVGTKIPEVDAQTAQKESEKQE
jgi:hypothetical protein